MTHRIAPQPSMSEFHVEAHYLTDFSMLWKLREMKLPDSSGLGELDADFLMRWQYHRRMLVEWRSGYGTINPNNAVVRDCLRFVDALVADWLRVLTGKEPETPLDIARLKALGEHRNKLHNIPGDKWEIKY